MILKTNLGKMISKQILPNLKMTERYRFIFLSTQSIGK